MHRTLAGLVLLSALVSLPSPVRAAHDVQHGHSCSAPNEGEPSFGCGLVIVYLETTVGMIDDVLATCRPSAVGVTGGEPEAVYGQRVYVVEVPVGDEIELRECYAGQEGVASAVLAGVGQLTPDTAMQAESQLTSALGQVLLLMAAMMAVFRRLLGMPIATGLVSR